MFPLGDDNPRLRLPIAMFALLGLNVLAWVLVQGLGTDPALAGSICRFGLITGDVLDTVPAGASFRLTPDLVCVIEGGHNWRTVFTSMFMHGGWFHIVGNMWFLWVFGDNVEDVMGPVRFVVFYLLCGVAAAVAQMLADTQSLVPMVGASGAIGGVMGAYALLFPRARVRTLVFLGFYVAIFWVPAILMLGYWFLIQLLGGLPTLGQGQRGGVAFLAHIGGFLAGLALAPVFARNDYLRQQRALPRLGP